MGVDGNFEPPFEVPFPERVLKGAISDTMGWIWSVKNGMVRADKKSIEQRSEQI
jgi:hypothetical protein